MIALIVSLQVRPGQLEGFTEAISENALRTFTDEPGCLYFDVTVDTADEHHFVFYELYRDHEALQAHRQAPHFKKWREAVARYVVEGSQENTITERLRHHA